MNHIKLFVGTDQKKILSNFNNFMNQDTWISIILERLSKEKLLSLYWVIVSTCHKYKFVISKQSNLEYRSPNERTNGVKIYCS